MQHHVINCSSTEVVSMFDNIAGNYDKLNHILSFGTDVLWRKKLVRNLKNYKSASVLDLAAGTGDLSIALNKINPIKIVLADPSEQMLSIARQKLGKLKLSDKADYVCSPAESLPFDDNSFNLVCISFGIRNFSNPQEALSEIFRVLKSSGALAILEFGLPRKNLFGSLYSWYSNKILPKIGKRISKDFSAYSYLPQTISKFPYGNDFVKMLEESHFKIRKVKKLSGGIAYMYIAEKQ